MPRFGPVSRADLVGFLKKGGFLGPYPRGKHQIMRKGNLRIILPNPHRGDVGVGLLARILRQAGISRQEWEEL